MTITFRITPTMLYRAQRAMMRVTAWMRWTGYGVLVLYPLVMIGLSLAYGGTALGALRNDVGSYVGLLIFWLVGLPILMRWTAARTFKNTPSFHGEIAWSFAEDGARCRTDVSSLHIGWAAVVRVVETKEFILMFQNKAQAIFLPKSAFPNVAAQQSFRSLLSSHLAGRVQTH
jgi:hypothetical protein